MCERREERKGERGNMCFDEYVCFYVWRVVLSVCCSLSSLRRQGAVDLEEDKKARQQERSAAFQGSGFRLGDNEGPSTVVRGQQTTKPSEKVK